MSIFLVVVSMLSLSWALYAEQYISKSIVNEKPKVQTKVKPKKPTIETEKQVFEIATHMIKWVDKKVNNNQQDLRLPAQEKPVEEASENFRPVFQKKENPKLKFVP